MPGQEKMISMITEPAIRWPAIAGNRLTNGSNEFLAAWRIVIRDGESPLAWPNSMKSSPSISTIAVRIVSSGSTVKTKARMSSGNTRCEKKSAVRNRPIPSMSGAPGVVMPPDGVSPSDRLNSTSAIVATQNDGADFTVRKVCVMRRSLRECARAAANEPRKPPSAKATSVAGRTSTTVLTSFSPSTVDTGSP